VIVLQTRMEREFMQSMKQKGFGLSLFSVVLGLSLQATGPVFAQAQTLLVAYAGQNETVGPMWIGIEKGTFKKYGLDVRMVQMRTGALGRFNSFTAHPPTR
jgi:ABC-type nitrate/sulfonate/bicarbonate transport system substrate-binding protein